MFRAILILASLACPILVGGCVGEKEAESWTTSTEIPGEISKEKLGDLLKPCPPCPDTVVWIPIDSLKCDSVFFRWTVTGLVDTVRVMPPGRWVETNVLCYWYLAYFCEDSLKLKPYGPLPDSVFIPEAP